MVCSAWFRERLRKVSLRKENDMVQDIDIKSKRILLFDFDGTLIETASGNTFATDLTDMRIKMDVVRRPALNIWMLSRLLVKTLI